LISKLVSIIKISRPVNVVITFISVLIAALICSPGKILEFDIFLAAFAASFTAVSGNIFNDIYDIEIDKINRPFRPLPSGKLTIKEAYSVIILFVTLSIFASLSIGYFPLVIVLFSHFLLLLYSKYLKRIPLVGNIMVSFLTGLVFVFGGVVVNNFYAALVPAIFAFLINLIREIVKDMEDVEGDKLSGINTLPIKYGFQKSKMLVLLITVLLIASTLYPFVSRLYKIEYFVVVMILVNTLLVYCIKILFEDHSIKNLKKINNLLKVGMVFGLLAIYLGV